MKSSAKSDKRHNISIMARSNNRSRGSRDGVANNNDSEDVSSHRHKHRGGESVRSGSGSGRSRNQNHYHAEDPPVTRPQVEPRHSGSGSSQRSVNSHSSSRRNGGTHNARGHQHKNSGHLDIAEEELYENYQEELYHQQQYNDNDKYCYPQLKQHQNQHQHQSFQLHQPQLPIQPQPQQAYASSTHRQFNLAPIHNNDIINNDDIEMASVHSKRRKQKGGAKKPSL